MKYNLSDILENADAEEAEAFTDSIRINYNNEAMVQRIKEKVTTETDNNDNHYSKIGRFSLKTIIAFAAVVAVLLCSITVGAATNFKMNKTFSRVFNSKNIDLSTIASDVNAVSEYNGYKFEMTQVICDGRTVYCVFNCPFEKGEMLVPAADGDVNITINGKEAYHSSSGFYVLNRICYLKFTNWDESHIKSNSKIHLDFNKISYNYDMNKTDIAERLLKTGKVTEKEIEEALKGEFRIYEMADEILYEEPVHFVDENALDGSWEWPSVDGQWSFDFEVGDTNAIKTIDADKVYPYDENNYIEMSPLGVYVFSFNPYAMPPIDFEHIFCIEMKDGKVFTDKDTVEIENGHHDGVSSSGYSDWEINEHRCFTHLALAEFINPDEVKSVSYYDKVLYQEQIQY